MVASPRDLAPLDVEHEKSLMDEAIEDLHADGLVKLTWLEGETWRDLQRAMRRDGPWHIFHFVGHGDFDLSAQEGLIAFTEKGTGRRHLLRSRDLARLLDGHASLRLVFLNSCEGARGSEGDPFSGTAATLVRRGIPAVVAMQYQITDKAAIEFCSAFYESLADGLPVDTAVTEARVAVSMDSVLEWGTPVLYMRSRDGRLFDISTEKRPSEQPLEITDQEALHEHQDRKERLDTIYAQARRSHQNQDWHAVVDIFEQISKEDQDYPDSEGLLASAHEALETATKEEESFRQYREVVEAAWADGELDSHEVERLRDLADELDLSPSHADDIERTVTGDTKEAILESQERAARERYRNVVEEAWADNHVSDADTEQLGALARELDLSMDTVVDIERDVMGDTKEAILERQEQAAQEKERQDRLDQLYARARRSHHNQEWQAVLDIFAEIHAEDPAYPDPEELLQSAHNALELTRKEQDTVRRYREAVTWAWVDEDLNGREVQRLRDLVSRLELSSNTAAGIEREVMGETKEAILDRQEQASAEHYRTAVEEASTDNELSNSEAKWLSNLASELGLSTDTAADVEREVIDDTIPAILQRQRRLDELYDQARQLHQGQEWESVVDVFERIHSEAPAFPDREGLLASAREALDQMHKVARLYDQALRYVDGSKWEKALDCFEEVQRLEPGYRDTEELLSRVRRALAPPSRAKVPDLSGQEVPQANSILTSEGLNLGAQREAPSDTVSKGQIIGHSPEAGREVEIGSSVTVTISLGPSTVSVPDLVGKSRDKALDMLHAVGLRLGAVVKAPSNEVAEGKIVEQYPTVESKVERGTAVRVTVAQGPIEDLTGEKPSRHRSYLRPGSLPDEPELRRQVERFSHESKELHSERGRKSEKPPDLPD